MRPACILASPSGLTRQGVGGAPYKIVLPALGEEIVYRDGETWERQ